MTLKCLGVHTDGGMRETMILPVDKLHRSEFLSLDQLALVETLGIGAHAVERSKLGRGQTAVVIGAGPIGLAAAQFAQIADARVILLDTNGDRLAFAREALDLAETITADDQTTQRLLDLTGGEGPDVIFDCTGNPASMADSFHKIGQGGTLVLVGIVQGTITFDDPGLHRREATLLASRNSTAADFHRIIHLIESGRIDTTHWITHRAAASEMIERFPVWLDPASRTVKAMVAW
jgi:2-desacetyl-2-hydroxyethyl bacteriochlorophyllide A dehydrogenase